MIRTHRHGFAAQLRLRAPHCRFVARWDPLARGCHPRRDIRDRMRLALNESGSTSTSNDLPLFDRAGATLARLSRTAANAGRSPSEMVNDTVAGASSRSANARGGEPTQLSRRVVVVIARAPETGKARHATQEADRDYWRYKLERESAINKRPLRACSTSGPADSCGPVPGTSGFLGHSQCGSDG